MKQKQNYDLKNLNYDILGSNMRLKIKIMS